MPAENLFVVEAACRLAPDKSSGTIVVGSKNKTFPAAIEELKSVDARNVALGWAAQQGVPDPRINGTICCPYPVNKEDKTLEDVQQANQAKPLPASDPMMQPAAYRTDIPICRKLV